jgi:hypothetical protein
MKSPHSEILQDELQANFSLCLSRILSRLLLLSEFCPLKSKFLVGHIHTSIMHSSVKGKFQEVFCLGIIADHYLGRLCTPAPSGNDL